MLHPRNTECQTVLLVYASTYVCIGYHLCCCIAYSIKSPLSKDSGIENLADLKGKRVAVQVTSKPEYILSNTNTPQVGVLYSMSTMEELYASLRKGYVDAIASALAVQSTKTELKIFMPIISSCSTAAEDGIPFSSISSL